jgi:hypothetical protein
MTNPATVIPPTIRNLVAANEGYFIEKVFSTPGMTVEGGAIIYEENFPANHFLDPNKSIAPRAPGSEAPHIAALRGLPSIARPESWSGRIEVTDEARRRNNVIEVKRQFTAAANTFADTLQTRGEATLMEAITAWGREVASPNEWDAAFATGIANADPNDLPIAGFKTLQQAFVEDKSGVKPDTLLLGMTADYYLSLIYGEKLDEFLRRQGFTNVYVSPRLADDAVIALKSGQVGVIAFEKPLDQEYVREGKRKTDVYVLETVPVFVANDASAIMSLTGVLGV